MAPRNDLLSNSPQVEFRSKHRPTRVKNSPGARRRLPHRPALSRERLGVVAVRGVGMTPLAGCARRAQHGAAGKARQALGVAMLKQGRNKLIVLTAVADCQLEFHDHRALERQDVERLAPLAGCRRLRCYWPRPAMTIALCGRGLPGHQFGALPSSSKARGNLLRERIQGMGKASLTKGRLVLLAMTPGTAIMALALALSACGNSPLANTSLVANSSPLASSSTSVSSPAPASTVSPSRAPIQWPPPPVSVKPAAPKGGKPVASWNVYWGQRAPKWPPVDLVIEIWYKNPGRASTFGGTFTTPILPGQSGSSGRIPLDRSGQVTFVPMINNADGNVIWAPDPVTINVPPVP
jgi:hypothetical protein